MSGFVVWFTGLSGAGKSTLAAMLSAELRARGVHVEVLDGDEARTNLCKGLGFSREDRDTNVRRIGYVAKLIARSGGCAMTAAISPYRAIRDEQRAGIPHFVEVYCECAISALAARDPKGLYKKALAGEIKHFTGIDDPYEAPESPEVHVRTDEETKEQSLARIVAKLEDLGHIARHGVATAPEGPAARGSRRLIAPHGGELSNRRVEGAEREALAERARGMPVLDLDERAESDVESIAMGAFSPLRGFMTSKDHLRVVREMRLEGGLPWPLPVTLAVGEGAAERLRIGGEAALRARDGRIVAVIEVSDLWRPDRELEAREIHGTTDAAHPGVAYLRAAGPVCVGGEIRVLDRAASPAFSAHEQSPAEARACFAARGWRRIVAFQARGPMHRGHEHITKSALEICDGLLIRSPVGGEEPGDIPADVRMRCIEELLRGYYPEGRVVLSTYPAAARCAGARGALLDAITQKNHGCSHIIVGRDHAGAKDAEELFHAFAPGEIGITPLFFEEAFYSTRAGSMATAKTAPGGGSTGIHLSEAAAWEMRSRGELPPPEVLRPEVARILAEALGAAARR